MVFYDAIKVNEQISKPLSRNKVRRVLGDITSNNTSAYSTGTTLKSKSRGQSSIRNNPQSTFYSSLKTVQSLSHKMEYRNLRKHRCTINQLQLNSQPFQQSFPNPREEKNTGVEIRTLYPFVDDITTEIVVDMKKNVRHRVVNESFFQDESVPSHLDIRSDMHEDLELVDPLNANDSKSEFRKIFLADDSKSEFRKIPLADDSKYQFLRIPFTDITAAVNSGAIQRTPSRVSALGSENFIPLEVNDITAAAINGAIRRTPSRSSAPGSENIIPLEVKTENQDVQNVDEEMYYNSSLSKYDTDLDLNVSEHVKDSPIFGNLNFDGKLGNFSLEGLGEDIDSLLDL